MYMISLYNCFYVLIISLPYYCSIRFLFSLRAGDLRVGGFFVFDGTVSCHYDDLWCRWWRRDCGLDWSPVFGARLAWYRHSFTVTQHCNVHAVLWNCFIMLGYFLYSIIIESFFFSHWKQRVVALTALSTLVAPWVVSTTNCGVTADGVMYRLDDPWFQCSFNMIFTLDFTVICTSLKCIWYFSLNTCFTMLG